MRRLPRLGELKGLGKGGGGGADDEPFPTIADTVLTLISGVGVYQDSAKTTPATADGSRIGAWADQSGGGRDALQADANKRMFRRNGVLNGKSSVSTEGSPQGLSSANTQLFSGAACTFMISFGPLDYHVVFSKTNVLVLGLASSNRGGYAVGNGTVSATYNTNTDVIYQNGTPVIITGLISATHIDVYKNGATNILNHAALSTPLSDISSPFNIGWNGLSSGAGKDFFVGLFDRVLSAAELNTVGGWLNRRLGITWTNF